MIKSAWLSILVNVVIAMVGVLQATDWVNIVGSNSAGMVATGLAVVNMLAHYLVGQNAAKSAASASAVTAGAAK